jgi:hypothetical protein
MTIQILDVAGAERGLVVLLPRRVSSALTKLTVS